jgi:hypothetical protein
MIEHLAIANLQDVKLRLGSINNSWHASQCAVQIRDEVLLVIYPDFGLGKLLTKKFVHRPEPSSEVVA